MSGWVLFGVYVGAWAWGLSPWLRFALLPGLMPTRQVPIFWWGSVVVYP
jgi:hypothetical protein